MNEMYYFLTEITDTRQSGKLVHSLADVILITFFATMAKANLWTEIYLFAERYEGILTQLLHLKNGIPSKDTIQRVMSLIDPKTLGHLQIIWGEIIGRAKEPSDELTILAIDGKTMRGNRSSSQKPLHIVSAYAKEEGICFGQVAVEEKSNEITAIPKLLGSLSLAKKIITIDAMGTQVDIAKVIRNRKGHYVLAVKKNQQSLYEEVTTYLDTAEFEQEMKSQGNSAKTIESARSQIETREYFQTDDINWMEEKTRWTGLKTIGKVVTTIEKEGQVTVETRYYISSLPLDIMPFKRAVRGHWSVESMHWHLDVTFGEDANKTLEKTAAQNVNILRKLALPFLKDLDLGTGRKESVSLKRYGLSLDFPYFLGVISANSLYQEKGFN